MTGRLAAMMTVAMVVLAAFGATGQEVIHLWEDGAPGFEDRKDMPEQAESYWVKNIHNPSVTAFLPDPDKATGAAVIIAPGGGHRELVFNAEGTDAARFLADHGVAAFALKYRLGREEGSDYDVEKVAREDGQRAMRLVRSRAEEWGIDKSRVGMMGFSAGGETLWLTAFTDADGEAGASDPVERESARPDWIVAVYPGPVGIPQSVSADAPQAFFVVANDDRGAARSIYRMMDLYTEAGVPFESHLYMRGGHAFNMGRPGFPDSVRDWPARLTDWMRDNYILSTEGRDEFLKARAEQAEQMQRRLERQRQRQQEGGAAGRPGAGQGRRPQ